ncbi:MAG: hypothetical protein LBF70_00985 [Holosporales bacterium]|jgi:hypothetical protein|nr:hypothetical protein [Holosporales bacterium]
MVGSFGAVGSNIHLSSEEFKLFEKDGKYWESFCEDDDESYNETDLEPTKAVLLKAIEPDKKAKEALDIFLKSDYRKFVDNCIENLGDMSEINQERYKEVLILLAPGLCSAIYIEKIIPVVCSDRKSVMAKNIKNLQFCIDMLFYGAVENGKRGRYTLARMFIDAFYAPCTNWDRSGYHDERFTSREIILSTFDDTCFDDWPEIDYHIKKVWPNWKSLSRN